MISIKRKKFGISLSEVYFAKTESDMSLQTAVNLCVQCEKQLAGFYPFKTRIVDLLMPEDRIFSAFSSTTRNEVRRAEKEGFRAGVEFSPGPEQIAEFACFYDSFSRLKRIPACNRNKLSALARAGALAITSVPGSDGVPLGRHAYVIDRSARRARFLYSASLFRGMDSSSDRNLIGRVNRYLHWCDMRIFKNTGIDLYDLGGIPMDDSDPVLNAIADFKMKFGGCTLVEYNGMIPGSRLGKVLLALHKKLR
ncbi:MAG: hypothetical protein A2583_03805 [Bdellovibrionales bacterium RIFOXYD1_FULL_53_11]|nr:MAG: hypothetical protein A2583_03805 [Bdellovibrionales bacterium RIFOXYD1_FULL_53_11]